MGGPRVGAEEAALLSGPPQAKCMVMLARRIGRASFAPCTELNALQGSA